MEAFFYSRQLFKLHSLGSLLFLESLLSIDSTDVADIAAARHQVENFFQRIKVCRRISTRYEKLAHTFLNFVLFVSIFGWLK